VVDELGRFFADVTAFDFKLTGIHTFPGGTVYLSPNPAAPFRQLTHELTRLFPEHPPYGGEFDDVVPHLTVPMPDGEEIAALEFELGSRFPISTYAREAVLFWWEPGASRTIATFPFGTSAA
jgi:2'-5' RNA ligase